MTNIAFRKLYDGMIQAEQVHGVNLAMALVEHGREIAAIYISAPCEITPTGCYRVFFNLNTCHRSRGFGIIFGHQPDRASSVRQPLFIKAWRLRDILPMESVIDLVGSAIEFNNAIGQSFHQVNYLQGKLAVSVVHNHGNRPRY